MNLDDYWQNAIWSIVPSIGVAAVFWFVLRGIIRADRDERKAHARIEQKLRTERDAARAKPPGEENDAA
ncbi:hypothetical protein [Microbacterium profundi]|uniref:hypothetical protein n=1 Tax=Microbacterium profundi TaxID=450380 RepID=UPI001F2C2F49|nr:hypothetical protein [Microbacterium profundi]MCE7483655.1 hypothetical protein [Microbacterium profundi]